MAESSLRLTFNGVIRLTGCSHCCMRWFLTVDGEECLQPAPIDAVLYSINASTVNIHRGSTVAGICSETVSGRIGVGEHSVVLNVGQCEGFNESYNTFTGLNSVSTFTLEEMPPRKLTGTSFVYVLTIFYPQHVHLALQHRNHCTTPTGYSVSQTHPSTPMSATVQ